MTCEWPIRTIHTWETTYTAGDGTVGKPISHVDIIGRCVNTV